MVVILRVAASLTGKEQERTAAPSTCTVQAPQSAMPQPYFVPVRPSVSRSTQRSGVSSAASTATALPLTLRVLIESPHGCCPAAIVFREAWTINDRKCCFYDYDANR